MISKTQAFLIAIASIIFVVFMAGFVSQTKSDLSKPNYYIRPSEIAVAEEKCSSYEGLTGLGVAFSKKHVNFHAICEDSREIIWKK